MQYETLCCSVATNNRVRDNERGRSRPRGVRPSVVHRQSVHTRARFAQCDDRGRNAQFPAENEQEETHKRLRGERGRGGTGRGRGGGSIHLSHTFSRRRHRPLRIGNVLLTARARCCKGCKVRQRPLNTCLNLRPCCFPLNVYRSHATFLPQWDTACDRKCASLGKKE